MSDVDDILFKETLINAYKYGMADKNIVLKKIMANYPNLRGKAKEILQKLEKVVQEVNSFSTEEVERIAHQEYAEEIKEEKKEREALPDLPFAEEGKVKVRYPPEPSKHPHVGQMLSFCINDMLAEKYKGKRVLRFDDTNPEKVRAEYYDSFREVILWMNLKIDEEVLASNYMEIYYERALDLIKKNDAFVCLCSREEVTKLRAEKKPCSCNLEHSVEKNTELFEKMASGYFSVGEAVVRLKGDMNAENAALRDPILLRISGHEHAIQGDKYLIWPMYDFESPIMENITGVTHILRSIEFGKMREELQSLISKKLGLTPPHFLEYSRFKVIGAPTQGRIIRELVEDKIVTGWDDYRLVTYQALKRRGIQPEVFPKIIERVGVTKSSTSIDWSLIFSINRKIIEPKVKHLYFVDNPIKIDIINPEYKKIKIPLHPYNKDLGERTIEVDNVLYLSGTDKDLIKEGSIVRMKELYNIKILKKQSPESFSAEIHSQELLTDIPKIQWVSDPIKVEIERAEMLYLNNRINKDSLRKVQGYGERKLQELQIGEIIQLERFGYTKINNIAEKVQMNYIHG
ncbi:MAG: glutamate--tRNA ligase [Candidatus Thorarchaeota archaeon]